MVQFLRRHDLDLICRAHQVVEDGYEFFARRHLVTLFSAPNYCGEFDNAGAMMSVDDTLMCSFQVGWWDVGCISLSSAIPSYDVIPFDGRVVVLSCVVLQYKFSRYIHV